MDFAAQLDKIVSVIWEHGWQLICIALGTALIVSFFQGLKVQSV